MAATLTRCHRARCRNLLCNDNRSLSSHRCTSNCCLHNKLAGAEGTARHIQTRTAQAAISSCSEHEGTANRASNAVTGVKASSRSRGSLCAIHRPGSSGYAKKSCSSRRSCKDPMLSARAAIRCTSMSSVYSGTDSFRVSRLGGNWRDRARGLTQSGLNDFITSVLQRTTCP